MEELISVVLFVLASWFIGKRIWDNIRHKKANAGCAKCDMNAATPAKAK
jgi:hypothetical protein